MQKPIFVTTAAAAMVLLIVTASPAQARFLQVDPVGYEDQQNLYAYVHNDPINLVDPTGECSSISDGETRSTCLEKREEAVENAATHLEGQSVSSSRKEAAYIATFDEETGEVVE